VTQDEPGNRPLAAFVVAVQQVHLEHLLIVDRVADLLVDLLAGVPQRA
jgi:hypothetical protein